MRATPSIARCIESRSVRSPCTTSAPIWRRASARSSSRRTKARTLCPLASSIAVRLPPISPAAPGTRIGLSCVDFGVISFTFYTFTFLSLVAKAYLFALSTERERKSLYPGIQKLNLEVSIADALRLSDQLVQPLFGNRAFASLIDIKSASCNCWLPVYEHAKLHGRSSLGRPHDEMKVACVEGVRDPPARLAQ